LCNEETPSKKMKMSAKIKTKIEKKYSKTFKIFQISISFNTVGSRSGSRKAKKCGSN